MAKLDGIIARYRGKPGGLIPVLEEAQMVLDYLPVPIQKRIADGLNLPLAQVYGVVTFYSFFTMKPRGRHTLRVCLGTACYVRGGKSIAENIVKEYKGRRARRRRTGASPLRRSAASGRGHAPVIVVDENVHGRVKTQKMKSVLDDYQ